MHRYNNEIIFFNQHKIQIIYRLPSEDYINNCDKCCFSKKYIFNDIVNITDCNLDSIFNVYFKILGFCAGKIHFKFV